MELIELDRWTPSEYLEIFYIKEQRTLIYKDDEIIKLKNLEKQDASFESRTIFT